MSSSPSLIDGKYELLELAGEGGMASVWKAQVRGAAGFQRAVAIKKIKSEYRAIRNYTDMFIEEARVGAELAHTNIVQVYDFCIDEFGSYYIVMEWVEGLDMSALVRSYRDRHQHVPWPLVVAAGIGTLRGLAAAHERTRPDGHVAPVVHRDVSPHNILIGTNGVAKLGDFGLARARDRLVSLTAPGTVKGKLSYLSPEVAMGGEATPASDLFAMGAVLWEALTGERLFDGYSDLEVFKKIRACAVRPLTDFRTDLPEELIAVIDRALTKAPDQRFGSAASFAFMLGEVLRLAPPGGDAQTTLGQAVAEARKPKAPPRPVAAVPQTSEQLPTGRWGEQPKVTARTAPAPPPAAQTRPGKPLPPTLPRTPTAPAATPIAPAAGVPRSPTPAPTAPAVGAPRAPTVPSATPGAPTVARKGPHTIPRGKTPTRPVPEPPTDQPSGMVDLPRGGLVGGGDSISEFAIAEISEEVIPLPPPVAGAKPQPLRGTGDSEDPLILPPKRR